MPRVVIAEMNHLGHQLTYVRRVVEAAKELTSDVVVVLSPEGLNSREFRTHLEPACGKLDIRTPLRGVRPGMAGATVDRARNVFRAVQSAKPDVLYLPTADGIAEAVGLAAMAGWRIIPRQVHSECLMVRLSFTYPGQPGRVVPPSVSLAALRRSPFKIIHLIDVVSYDWMRRNNALLSDRCQMIGEPIEQYPSIARCEARRELGLPDDGRYLVCPGMLVARKGINHLLNAFYRADLRQTDRLLLAGPVDGDVAQLLDRDEYRGLIARGRLLVLDRYMNTLEMARVMSVADVICAPNPNQPHPSSISVRALACGRPVLGADTQWLGYMIPLFQMGWTVNVTDPEAFAGRLRGSLEEAPQWLLSEAARRLLRFQSVENFRAGWIAGLRSLMGKAPDEGRQRWEWVCEALDDRPAAARTVRMAS